MAGKTNYDKFRQRIIERKMKADMDDRWWKPEVARHLVRILPPFDGFDNWYLPYGVHYNVMGEDSYETVTCPRLTLKKRCYICEFTRGLWKSGKKEDEAIARKIGAKARACSNVLVLSKAPGEVKIWGYGTKGGQSVLEQLEEHCVTASGDIVKIDDPVIGVNMKLNVTQRATPEGIFPNYLVTPEPVGSPLKDKSVLERLHNLIEIVHGQVKSYDEIRSLMKGFNSEGDPQAAPAMESGGTEVVTPDEGQGEASPDVSAEEEVVVEEKSNAPKPEGGTKLSAEEIANRARAALAKRTAAK